MIYCGKLKLTAYYFVVTNSFISSDKTFATPTRGFLKQKTSLRLGQNNKNLQQ